MPIIVACPTCGGQLRVGDDLVGRKVRCPVCNGVFDAVAAPPPTRSSEPAPPPAPARAPIPDASLWPSYSDPPAERNGSEAALPVLEVSPGAGLRGAVELPVAGNEAPRPSERIPTRPPPADRSDRPPPRLHDDHDDLRGCPECGKSVHRDARRCYNCGARLDDRDGLAAMGQRRDTEPHRGGTVLTLGIVSLVVCGPIGLVCGLIAWVMGHGDLRKIRLQQLDPQGAGTTQAGWICGIIGTVLNLVLSIGCLASCGGFKEASFYSAGPPTRPMGAPPAQRFRPGVPPPPPKPGKPGKPNPQVAPPQQEQ